MLIENDMDEDLFSEDFSVPTIDVSSDDEDMDVVPGIPANPSFDRFVRKAAEYGMCVATFQALVLFGAPPVLFNLLWFLFHNPLFSNIGDLQVVEFFSGRGSTVYRAAQGVGLRAAKFDKDIDDKYHDILGGLGFLTALQLARRMLMGDSFASFATKCSSWVWLSRSVTKRTNAEPMGPRQNPHRTD